MVAVIKTSNSLKNSLNYNEHKRQKQVAELIYSNGFAKDKEQLTFYDKIRTFEKLTSLNERTRLNSVHISLNFDVSEKLKQETFQQIADSYMQGIGFGEQPYLVYQHFDAGHPHLHIVTTNIQRNGERISMQNIGRNQSEKARKQIEKDFNLVKAEEHHQQQVHEIKPVNAQKVQYGKSDIKRAITNVLDAILNTYKYTSIYQLNALLKQYNVFADQGTESSKMYKAGGLLYRILNDKGQPIGIPIKASTIYSKPALKYLLAKFKENEPLKQKHKLRVKNAIDLSFAKDSLQRLNKLIEHLNRDRIQVIPRQNKEGVIFGITYIDHQSKCIFNGSELGKAYSATQILNRCKNDLGVSSSQKLNQEILELPKKERSVAESPAALIALTTTKNPEKHLNEENILKEIMQPEFEESPAAELRNDHLKKRRKKLHH